MQVTKSKTGRVWSTVKTVNGRTSTHSHFVGEYKGHTKKLRGLFNSLVYKSEPKNQMSSELSRSMSSTPSKK